MRGPIETPWTPDELSDEFLTQALRNAGVLRGGRVVNHVVGIGPDTGLVATAVPLDLSFEEPEVTTPKSVYAKFTRHAPEVCQTEVGFYNDLAHALGDSVPRCYGAWWNGRGRSLILLEDLREFPVGTWWTCTPKDAAQALRAIAPAHATWWGSPPDVSWLGPSRSLTEEAIKRLESAIEPFASRFQSDATDVLVAASRAIVDNADALAERQLQFPQTLTHQDFHSQNVFLSSRPRGRATVFDWQLAAAGSAATDVAYLLASSLGVAERRASEAYLLEEYRSALAKLGVHNLESRDFSRAYALGLFRIVYVVVTTLGLYPKDALKGANRRARTFGINDGWIELIRRVSAAVADHRFLALLR